MINKINSVEVIMKYILVLLIILNSKTVYFGIINNTLTQYAFISFFIVGLIFLRFPPEQLKLI